MKLLLRTVTIVAVVFPGVTNLCVAQAPPLFNVNNYGATGNGTIIDTPAINSAIIAANVAGGGTVVFPAGNYLSTSIHLSNNVTLYLSNSAVILAASTGFDPIESSAWSAYQDFGHTYFHDALIWGENLTNIGLAGPGKIDGNNNLQHNAVASTYTNGQGDKVLSLRFCTNVTVTDITITRAGHFGILANCMNTMLVSNAFVLCSTARDAFNLISSSHVRVLNSDIEGSDDAMVLKSDYALGMKIDSTDIRVDNCKILSTENNATQFGSETVGGFTDVAFTHLNILGAGKAGIGITSNDGSIIDGITYDGVTMTNCACTIFLKLDNQGRAPGPPPVGRIRNVSINNVTAVHSTLFSRTNTATIDGYPGIPIENITFSNVNISTIGARPASDVTIVPPQSDNWTPDSMGIRPSFGWYLRTARNISYSGCLVHFDIDDGRPALMADSVTNLLFDGLIAQVGSTSAFDAGFTNCVAYDITNSVNTTGGTLRLNPMLSTAGGVCAPPFFNPPGGIYSSNGLVVALASSTAGASMRYTTDGTTPTPSSGTLYSGPVTINSNTMLKAVAWTGSASNSSVNTAIYLFATSTPPPLVLSLEAESLAFVAVGAPAVVQTDANSSGGLWMALLATNTGAYIDYTLPNIPAGVYDVQMEYKAHPNRGIISMSLDGKPIGPATLDQYVNPPAYPTLDLGEVAFNTTGNHTFRQTVVGKNPSAGAYTASADRFVLTQIIAGAPPAPAFSGISHPTAPSVLFGGTGVSGLPYNLLAADSLPGSNWTSIGTVVPGPNGSWQFNDPAASNHPARYYRLATP